MSPPPVAETPTPQAHKGPSLAGPQATNTTGTESQNKVNTETKNPTTTADFNSKTQNIELAKARNPVLTVADPNSTQQSPETASQTIEVDLSKNNPTTEKVETNTNSTAQKEFIKKVDAANKIIGSATNIAQVIGNSISFITKFPFLSRFKDIGDKLGQWTTKLFLLGNGLTNAVKQYTFNNYTSLVGYLVYVYNGLFVPQHKAYMVNGFGVGLTQLGNQVNDINGRSTFTSASDHFKHLRTGLWKLIKAFANPIKAYNEGKPIIGAAGGFAALAGSSYWAATGDEKTAALVRDGGGLGLDVAQVSKPQFKYKRIKYILSGAFYIVGTFFDLISKFAKPLEPYCRPLCFLFDGLGRYYQGASERCKEMSNEHLSKAEIAEIEANYKTNEPSYMTLVKELFSKTKSKIENANIVDNAPYQGDFASAAA